MSIFSRNHFIIFKVSNIKIIINASPLYTQILFCWQCLPLFVTADNPFRPDFKQISTVK